MRIRGVGLAMPESIHRSDFHTEAGSLLEDVMNPYQRMADARYIISQAVPTEMIMTMNVRELRQFFSLRYCNKVQWEIRQIADEMFKLCRKAELGMFRKTGPGCVFRGASGGEVRQPG